MATSNPSESVRSECFQSVRDDIEAGVGTTPAPAEMGREKGASVPAPPLPARPRPSFFCGPGFLSLAVPLTVVLSTLLYAVSLPLLLFAAAGVYPALYLYFYMSSFMPLHDWAEKVLLPTSPRHSRSPRNKSMSITPFCYHAHQHAAP